MDDRLQLLILAAVGVLVLLTPVFRARGAARLEGPALRARRRAVGTSILTALAAGGFVMFSSWLGVNTILLVIGVVTAGPTGRAVQRDWPGGAASAGPYPGLPYAVPMGLIPSEMRR
jgi:hypothetical protein